MGDVAVERQCVSGVELVDVVGHHNNDRSGLDVQQLLSTGGVCLALMTFPWIEGPIPQLDDVRRLRTRNEDAGPSMAAIPEPRPFTGAHKLGRTWRRRLNQCWKPDTERIRKTQQRSNARIDGALLNLHQHSTAYTGDLGEAIERPASTAAFLLDPRTDRVRERLRTHIHAVHYSAPLWHCLDLAPLARFNAEPGQRQPSYPSRDSSEVNGDGTKDGQNPRDEGANEELLGFLPSFILTDLRESNDAFGGNDRGDSSGRLDGGEQENENALKRTDPTTAPHWYIRITRPLILLWTLTSDSKNVRDDSISRSGQEDDDSDDGGSLGRPRAKRLRRNGADRHSKEQESCASKSRASHHSIQTILRAQPHLLLLPESRHPHPPSLRNKIPARPRDRDQDDNGNAASMEMKNSPPHQDAKDSQD